MLEDLYISVPKENIRKEVLKDWAALAPGEDFGILPGLTADYLMIGDTRISVSKSHRKELMKRFSSFLGDSL